MLSAWRAVWETHARSARTGSRVDPDAPHSRPPIILKSLGMDVTMKWQRFLRVLGRLSRPLAAFVWLLSLSGWATASATYVGSVTYSISPLQPAPNSPFTLTATFHGAGNGQPCDISNIQARIQDVTINGRPRSGYTHPPSHP